jgi:hypothetical protein
MSVLQEIMQLLDGVEIKANKVIEKTPKIRETAISLREVERLALRYLAISRRMGLPDDIQKATELASQLLVMVRMLQMSMALMSGGPVGILIGLAGVASVALTSVDMIGYDSSRGY